IMNFTSQEIGIVAGRIWNYLNEKNNFVELLRLKFDLKLDNTILYLALGWLAREDKIEFLVLDEIVKVKLK
ncbi:MAG: winged helix-turn-helix domain-containing protein, partial [Elusimicrobiota bacterium]|nr:winged helix-turn-helix domain-containing protein [Endomicrobiia bacterium]MDW8165871.1 winged helix-turn-helix domain-containing protein [Elusimicrobiota bacterium]